MARVFTVYNCGTNFSRDNKDETVANLADRTAGAENRDWMINAGPGSASSQRSITPGTSRSDSEIKRLVVRVLGLLGGYGWEQNVEHTLDVINALNAGSSQTLSGVNLVGWSRGGITCFMIAHALHEQTATRHLPVNIFAFDPVPGPFNFDDPHKTSMPPNVQHYAAVLQEDESRFVMKPVALPLNEQGPGQTRVFYPMPGAHSAGVSRRKTDSGLVASYLAHQFLQQHGTGLTSAIQLSSRDLCELYAHMRLDMIGNAKRSRGGLFRQLHSSRKEIINEFRDTVYFINWHHAQHFQQTFPTVWQAMETGITAANEASFDRAADNLRMHAPTTYESLVQAGIF
jgi:hypothetical protein